VNAVPPFTQLSQNLVGIDIAYPKIEQIIQNSNFTLFIHVFNTSNGMPLSDAPSCYLCLYDEKGNQMIENQEMEIENLKQKAFIDNSNTSNIGINSYIVWCNGTANQGGFADGTFEVVNETITNKPTDSETSIYIMCVIFFGIVFLLSLAGAIAIKGKNKYTMGETEINYGKYLKVFMMYSAYFTAWILVFFTQLILEKYFTMSFISNFLSFVFQIMGIGNVVVLPILFFILIADWIADKKLMKEQKRNLPPR
jgi:hypothetical protein